MRVLYCCFPPPLQGVFESWLHPSRYRTQLCKDHEKCDRPVCFFAHSLEELRTPENSFVPGPEERLRVPEAMQVMMEGHRLLSGGCGWLLVWMGSL